MQQFNYKCFKKALTIDDVKDQLYNLDNELIGTDLDTLIAFNHTYLIITNTVGKQFSTHFFANDKVMDRIDTCFGNYYFNALNNYIQGNDCPLAWKITFDSCRANTSYGFIYMALGVNAHVNNDLPQTLYDCRDHDNYEDYEKINDLINDSIPLVIKELHEQSTFLHTCERVGLLSYHFILHTIIRKWRSDAWNSYLKLRENKIDKREIEVSAGKKAKALASIKNWQALLQVF